MIVKTSNHRHGLAGAAVSIFNQTLSQCSVEQAFLAKLQPRGADQPYAFTLRGGPGESPVEINLEGISRVIVIAAGKGGATMLDGLLSGIRLPAACQVSGVLVSPERPDVLPDGVEYFAGGHPLPTIASFDAARAALSMIRQAAADAEDRPTYCFFLISGGASAMMELPLDEGISLEDTVGLYRALVHSGASIAEINCVRKHFSAIKGGRLGLAAAAIPSLTVLVSDVPRGELDALASGPTLPDTSTRTQCLEIVERFGLLQQFPASVRQFFASPELPETPKPGAFPVQVVTLLSSDDLAEAARLAAEALGFAVVVDETSDDWDYRRAAEYLLRRLRELRQQHAKVCLISPGEVTVTVSGETDHAAGVGGRNQHLALYAATLLELSDRPTVVFSAGSDGIDGNSPFAGAVLDYDAIHDADRLGPAEDALRRFDSSTFLEKINATISTGPTGNNLRDLRLLLVDESMTA